MKAFIINPNTGIKDMIQAKEIQNNLDTYYSIIGCRCIDIVHYPINGKNYDIIVDDEGLFVSDPVVTAVDKSGYPLLVGALIITNYDGEGNETALEPGDVARIASAIRYTVQGDRVIPVIIIDF
jgi:hypothetical protein